jgi:hypothetical protein
MVVRNNGQNETTGDSYVHIAKDLGDRSHDRHGRRDGSRGDEASGERFVIVHGALVDAAGWRAVYDVLSKDGFHVTIVQEPLLRHQWHSRGLDLGDVADRLCRTWPSRISASAEENSRSLIRSDTASIEGEVSGVNDARSTGQYWSRLLARSPPAWAWNCTNWHSPGRT